MFYKKNHSQAPIGPEANYNSKTGKPDTTGAASGDLGTLRARVLEAHAPAAASYHRAIT